MCEMKMRNGAITKNSASNIWFLYRLCDEFCSMTIVNCLARSNTIIYREIYYSRFIVALPFFNLFLFYFGIRRFKRGNNFLSFNDTFAKIPNFYKIRSWRFKKKFKNSCASSFLYKQLLNSVIENIMTQNTLYTYVFNILFRLQM